MHFAEFIIVYLAYGAPFGVYEVTCSRRKLALGDIHRIAAKFIFWPVVLGFWIRRWLIVGYKYTGAALDNEINVIRQNLESLAFGDDSAAAAVLQFREVFNRYTGLILMTSPKRPFQKKYPVLELSVQGSPKVAIACIERLDRQRIVFHQQRARREFLEFIGRLSVSRPPGNIDIILSSVELAMILNDFECGQVLSAMVPSEKGKRMGRPISAPKTVS
jgi:hypothetical protein